MKKREQANVCKKTTPASMLSWEDNRGRGSLFLEKSRDYTIRAAAKARIA